MTTQTPLTDAHADVLICGGGLAGLTLALQLRQTLRDLSVIVVEPTTRPLDPATHKVGESSVELGSLYLERLGLRRYLRERHIVKCGLRFFPGGGHLPIEQRVELGPPAEPVVSSYQMDRGILESDLRGMIVDAGARLVEGARVTAVELAPGDSAHTADIERGSEAAHFTARWLIDATGRRALIRRQSGLTRPSPNICHAGWFRVSGRIDINDMVPDRDALWHARPGADNRWRSTNHFMGPGYWAWFIPLTDGRTSVGLVVHQTHHGFDAVRTLERCRAFLAEHEPHLAAFLDAHIAREAVLDFRCLKGYSHDTARSFSADRWAVVGDAGAFSDPLYSPGTDAIAVVNTHAVELIAADVSGGDLAGRTVELEEQTRSLFTAGFGFFAGVGEVFGYGPTMAAKLYWDNFVYWSYFCQYFVQDLQTRTGHELAEICALRDRFFTLNQRAQTLFVRWAELATETPPPGFFPVPGLGSLGAESHVSLLTELDHEGVVDYFEERLDQATGMLSDLVLRSLADLGPAAGAELLARADVGGWLLSFSARRIGAEDLTGKARRRALGVVARDLDAVLQPVRRDPDAISAMRLALAAG